MSDRKRRVVAALGASIVLATTGCDTEKDLDHKRGTEPEPGNAPAPAPKRDQPDP